MEDELVLWFETFEGVLVGHVIGITGHTFWLCSEKWYSRGPWWFVWECVGAHLSGIQQLTWLLESRLPCRP